MGKGLEALKAEKGEHRRMLLELLYRCGGLKDPEIAALFSISYTAVSQELKRRREWIMQDRALKEMMDGLEMRFSI